MVYVIERFENGAWVYLRNHMGVVMFSKKRDAEAMVRRLGAGYRVRKVVD